MIGGTLARATPTMRTPRIWISSTLGGLAVGALVGGLMMYVAWQHNPQGAFYDSGQVHFADWFWVGVSWFVPVAFVVGLAPGGTASLSAWLSRRTELRPRGSDLPHSVKRLA